MIRYTIAHGDVALPTQTELRSAAMDINERNKLVDAADDYINEWHNFLILVNASKKAELELSPHLKSDIEESASNIGRSPFRALMDKLYQRDIKYIFRNLNEPHATSTSLTSRYEAMASEIMNDHDLFVSGIYYVLAASVFVSGRVSWYAYEGVKAGLLSIVDEKEEVIEHARDLLRSILKCELDISEALFLELFDLAEGRFEPNKLVPTIRPTELVVREIVLITKDLFNATNNRGVGRFSVAAIERIIELLGDIGLLTKQIKGRQISNLQKKYLHDNSPPLTFNQMDIPFG